MGTNPSARGAPYKAPQPSTWRGRSEQILLNQVGCEARKIPAEGKVFFLDFYLYRASGVANIPVLVGGNSTGVDGLGPTNRIYLQSNLASVESRDQIEFTIGHELKHYVMGDNWKALAIIAVFLLAGFWLTDRLGRTAIRRFSRRWGFSTLSDPASLPLIVFMFTLLWLAILPFFNLFSRHIELEADRFGLELTHQNHAAAMIFVRDAQTSLAPDWGTFFLISQATHPSIRERIEFANSYKPWEQGALLVYGDVCKSE